MTRFLKGRNDCSIILLHAIIINDHVWRVQFKSFTHVRVAEHEFVGLVDANDQAAVAVVARRGFCVRFHNGMALVVRVHRPGQVLDAGNVGRRGKTNEVPSLQPSCTVGRVLLVELPTVDA